MKTLGNILWFIIVGLISAISWSVAGLLLCITIIGIPFGKQCFKIAGVVLTPFKKTIKTDFGKHPIGNLLWMIFFGWELAIAYLVMGLFLCVTIIGIPFGKQCFKLMALGLIPMGAEIKLPKETI